HYLNTTAEKDDTRHESFKLSGEYARAFISREVTPDSGRRRQPKYFSRACTCTSERPGSRQAVSAPPCTQPVSMPRAHFVATGSPHGVCPYITKGGPLQISDQWGASGKSERLCGSPSGPTTWMRVTTRAGCEFHGRLGKNPP